MTDRELLELAAKAARIEILGVDDGNKLLIDFVGVGVTEWNPITDDGDALRLANFCNFSINRRPNGVMVVGDGRVVAFEEYEDCRNNAATRRAIVRAAAALAKEGEA